MLDTATRVALSPLLIAQALRVRRIAQSLPEPPGPRAGIVGTGAPLALGIIGDSSAAGVGAAAQADALSGQLTGALSARFEVDWHLDALTGATTRSTLARLDPAVAEPADVVITALGVNDVTRLVPPRKWLAQQKVLHDRIAALYGPRQIYVSGMPPLEHFPLLPNPLRWTLARQGRAFEEMMTRHASQAEHLTHMPFAVTPRPELMASDGFHPSPVLYRIWAEVMAEKILADWPGFGITEEASAGPQLRGKASR